MYVNCDFCVELFVLFTVHGNLHVVVWMSLLLYVMLGLGYGIWVVILQGSWFHFCTTATRAWYSYFMKPYNALCLYVYLKFILEAKCCDTVVSIASVYP